MTLRTIDRTPAPTATSERTPVSIETSFAAAVTALRQLAAEMAEKNAAERATSGGDDSGARWAAEVLDHRPLFVVSVFEANAIQTWVMEPLDPTQPHSALRGVLHAQVSHRASRDHASASCPTDTKAHIDVAQAIGWLYREQHAEFPRPQPIDSDEVADA